MTLEEFDRLPMTEKVHKTFELGDDLGRRNYLYYQVRLYMIDDFYVEIWYHPNLTKIERVEIISSEDVFAHYYEQIDISDALSVI
ncbi:MAG: hypothetical protein WCM76_02560 [Bacteroidota bacterium]